MKLFPEEQFVIICYDMFQGGFETTSNTLGFGLIYLMLHPEKQEKAQAELDSVYQKKEIGSLLDKGKYVVRKMGNSL